MHFTFMLDALHAVPSGAVARAAGLFAEFAQAFAPTAVAAMWQGALVVVALVLCLRLAPRVSATHRYFIWAAAFAVVAALPVLPMLAQFSSAAAAQASSLRAVAARPWLQLQLDSRWGFAVAALWLIASLVRAADVGFHSLRLRQLWKAASPVQVDADLRSVLAAASSTRRCVEICTTQELDRPSVIGFFAPRILIPEWLFERLTPGELEHVVLHEAEHLRRRDDWTNLLQKLSLVLFPLNPALAWMERRLCREREMACDEGVVRRTQAPRAYAACLTRLAERSLNHRSEALSLGAWQRRPELVRRVHSILRRKRASHPFAARAWVGAVGCGLLVASVELARCPQIVTFVPEKTSAPQHLAKAQKTAPSRAFVERASVRSVPARDANLAAIPRADSRVIAIDTKAILPDRRPASSPLTTASQGPWERRSNSAEEQDLMAIESGASFPHQVLLKAQSPAASGPKISRDDEPRVIVLTAWEQVQIGPQSDGNEVCDHYAAPVAQQQDGKSDDTPDSKPATRITVTRLILTVYPAAFRPHSMRSRESYSNLNRAAAVPFDGGWLVFQL